ncbi:hypothetical protein KNJ79_05460 [Sphingopyxis indica]|uniref:hypothetical protein n=1 Tax=Sphingopyxis indica TaxID=436663 RepID=UPI00293903C8|nr:hypothetical protein [Sphingopyxis indica]WOF44381.1 hypothetical protein KNJ79_05460 [Sphingopyxis indica]
MIKKLTYSVTFPTNGISLSGDLSLQPGSTAFVGPNGSGKTFGSIELIRYLLFGKKALRGPASDYKALSAEGIFEIAGKEYRVERLPRKETLWGPDGEVLAVNTEAVNQKLLDILGFGLDVFDVVCAARQKDSERLSQMKPAERKRLIDRILGLTAQEKAEKDCKDEATGHRKLAEALADGLVRPEEPARPVSYRPVEELETALAAVQTYEKEKARLEAIVAQVGEEPPMVAAPSVDIADLEGRAEAARSLRQAHQARLAELERIPLPVYTLEQIEASEAYHIFRTELDRRGPKPTRTSEELEQMRHVWHQLQAADGDEVTCPQCDHSFVPGRPEGLVEPELSLAEIKVEERANQMWETPLATTLHPEVLVEDPAAERAAHAQADRRRELEDEIARYVEPEDVSKELAEARELLADYRAKASERERWEARAEAAAEARTALQNLKVPEGNAEELSQALVESRVYDQLLAAYWTQRNAYDEAQAKIADAKQKAKDFSDGAKALADARGLVKAYLAPSLSKVATSLIHQMTNGVLSSVEVDEDMNIMVDGQDIGTLSGAGATVANLAVRIGLGRVLVSQIFPVFIGDEIDSDMDAERAAATAEAVASLSDQLEQMLIVTHKEVDYADQVVIHPLA